MSRTDKAVTELRRFLTDPATMRQADDAAAFARLLHSTLVAMTGGMDRKQKPRPEEPA